MMIRREGICSPPGDYNIRHLYNSTYICIFLHYLFLFQAFLRPYNLSSATINYSPPEQIIDYPPSVLIILRQCQLSSASIPPIESILLRQYLILCQYQLPSASFKYPPSVSIILCQYQLPSVSLKYPPTVSIILCQYQLPSTSINYPPTLLVILCQYQLPSDSINYPPSVSYLIITIYLLFDLIFKT